jgi:hypothetical protein
VADSGFGHFTQLDTVEQYEECFRRWRTEYEHRLTSFERGTKHAEQILATIELYDRYAQLIVASYALQRALEAIPSEVPYTLRRVSCPMLSSSSKERELMLVAKAGHSNDTHLRGRIRNFDDAWYIRST